MQNPLELAIWAAFLGALVGTVLFVPFVFVSYRRRGHLTLGRFALWAGMLVYFIAIWTYTLLPLPQTEFVCAAPQLDPTAFLGEISRGLERGGILSREIGQLVLNVLLFLPLGFFLRMLFGRGVLVALGAGLGLSLVIELTQLTGVWGIYPCAYRLFDVADLMTNGLGAVLGSVLSLAVPYRYWAHRRVSPERAVRAHPVTRTRRLLGMFCDGLGAQAVTMAVVLVVQLGYQFATGRPDQYIAPEIATGIGNAVAVGVWLVVTLVSGRTVGDLAVELEYRGSRMPSALARLARFGGGIGGFLLLSALPGGWGQFAWLFGLVSIVLVFTPVGARGLPGLVAGARLADAREGAVPARGAAASEPLHSPSA